MDRKWKLRVTLVVGIALISLGTVVASTGDGCDMKTVEKAFYCEPCKATLAKKELVSKKKYYECEGCQSKADKSGKCEACDKKRAKKVTDKGVCPRCFAKPVPAEACVKDGYACPKCGDLAAKPAKCGVCKAKHKKVPVRAVILYRCEGCGKSGYAPGNCESADCAKKGTAKVRTCSQSGNAPHAKPAARGDRKGSRKKK
jgi:hypothetical protein